MVERYGGFSEDPGVEGDGDDEDYGIDGGDREEGGEEIGNEAEDERVEGEESDGGFVRVTVLGYVDEVVCVPAEESPEDEVDGRVERTFRGVAFDVYEGVRVVVRYEVVVDGLKEDDEDSGEDGAVDDLFRAVFYHFGQAVSKRVNCFK